MDGVFVALFLAMALSDFPRWQRLGFALILSVIYGLGQIKRNEKQWVAKAAPQRAALFGKMRDRIGIEYLQLQSGLATYA